MWACTVGGAAARRRGPLSRGVCPARSWGLRGSGEDLLLRRRTWQARTLPHGMCDYTSEFTPAGLPAPELSAACHLDHVRPRSAGATGPPAVGQLVVLLRLQHHAVGPLGLELVDGAADLPHGPADRDAEHALTALQQVDDLFRRGALVDGGAVA